TSLILNQFDYFFLLFTACAKSDPAFHFATVSAGIFIFSFVCGLCPSLAFHLEVEKVPKPTHATLSPSDNALFPFEVKESKAFLVAAFVMPASAAIASINSDLFII